MKGRAIGVLASLVGGAAAGALAGVVWERVWTPPTGVFYGGAFYLDATGQTSQFSGTGWFTLVGAVTGVALGLVLTLAWRSAPVVALVTSILSAALATVVMVWVGHRLGPVDPDTLAKGKADYAPGVLDLSVATWPAYAVVVVGALTVLLLLLSLTGLGSPSAHEEPRSADMIAT